MVKFPPADIGEVEHRQPDIILMIRDVDVFLQTNDFGIADIGSVEKRAEKKQSQYGENSE